jgi:energy-coupling factor transporter ATP-binding protein EcfA2
MSSDQPVTLSKFLNEEHPFGPLDPGPLIDSDLDQHLYCEITSDLNLEKLRFLVGRSGSGKTALLRSIAARQNDPSRSSGNSRNHTIVFSADSFAEAYSLVNRNDVVAGRLEINAASAIWQEMILARVARHASDQSRNSPADEGLEQIKVYLKSVTLRQPREVAKSLLREDRQMPTLLFSLDRLKEALNSYLSSNGIHYLVIIDRADVYDWRDELVSNLLAGLWRAVDRLNEVCPNLRSIASVRQEICSERHLQTALKEIRNGVEQLNWGIDDLLYISAYRFWIFLRQNRNSSLSHRFSRLFPDGLWFPEANRRPLIVAFWEQFLPRTMGALREPSLNCLARHTQLIPRQFICLFSEVALRSHKLTDGWGWFPDNALLQGLDAAKRQMVSDVFESFADVYPNAESACRSVFSNLTGTTSYDQLWSNWSEHAKDVMKSMNLYAFEDFLRMVQVMGMIGVIDSGKGSKRSARSRFPSGTPQSSVPYVFANFGYERDLRITRGDRIAIHPMFSGLLKSEPRDPICPIGCDLYTNV